MAVVTADQVVSIHTIKGGTLYEFTPDNNFTLGWGRSLRRTSKCDLAAPPVDDSDRLPDIVPWLHWVSVWDGNDEALLWTGPIEKARASPSGLAVTAKDHSAFLRRTEVPSTLDWESTDPAQIAEELWRAMIDQHGLNVEPIVRTDPEGDRFDFSVIAAVQMLDATVDELVRLGLRWNVTTGVPILGPMPTDPRADLTGADFVDADIGLLRDGTETFNSVRVRGADGTNVREVVDLHGLMLQTIVNIDSMFGVSNVARAARQYARHTAGIRTALDIPTGVELAPDAPLSIHELVPSSRFVVAEHGLRELVELETVDVERTKNRCTVKIGLESVIELPELGEIADENGGAA